MSKKLITIALLVILSFVIIGILVFSRSQQIISVTNDGFEPNEITIKKGDTVTWENKGEEDHWPASNPHPIHDIYPEFDPKQPVPPGQSWSFTFGRIGEWSYHDHFHPNKFGKVTVEP